MSPKLPPTLENFSLLTFSSIYPLLLVSCTPQPELEMIGKWEFNPNLEQTWLIPGTVLEWWGAAKRSQEHNPRGIQLDTLLQWFCWECCQLSLWSPTSCFYLINIFGQNPLDPSCVRGHKQPSKKSTFKWNPGWESSRMVPWTRPQPELCFPAVLHAKSWKGKQQN